MEWLTTSRLRKASHCGAAMQRKESSIWWTWRSSPSMNQPTLWLRFVSISCQMITSKACHFTVEQLFLWMQEDILGKCNSVYTVTPKIDHVRLSKLRVLNTCVQQPISETGFIAGLRALSEEKVRYFLPYKQGHWRMTSLHWQITCWSLCLTRMPWSPWPTLTMLCTPTTTDSPLRRLKWNLPMLSCPSWRKLTAL